MLHPSSVPASDSATSLPDHTLVFLHIPKTAGISLREILLAARAPHQTFRINHPIDDQARLQRQSDYFKQHLGLVEGHLYYGIHHILPRPSIYLTMLRHPVDRILSYYSFVRQTKHHHLHEAVASLSLAQCLERKLTIELDNFMVRSFTGLHNVWVPFGGVTRDMLAEAKAHLDSIAALGLTEHFDESLARFAAMFNWPTELTAAPPRLNTTPDRLRADHLSPADRAAIEACNELDLELYNYGVDQWNTRATACPVTTTFGSE
jgi:hypothetical protein